jgi:hypothetical protein
VAETASPPGRWVNHPVPQTHRSVAELIAARTLDAELAATSWVLIEGRVPIIVAGDVPGVGASTLLAALLDFLPPGLRVVEVAGPDETFAWLPQASDLGWRRSSDGTTQMVAGTEHGDEGPVRPDDTVIIVPELSDRLPSTTWGEVARIAVRAAAIGYGLAATMRAERLETVFDALRRPPVLLTDDELSRIGLVLLLARLDDGRRRVVAAHYVRPLARDEHGHIQRLGPAVLSTWDDSSDTHEHFGWGILPELARRLGRKAGDLELEIDRRRALLDDLVAAGRTGTTDVRAAIDADRARRQTPVSTTE